MKKIFFISLLLVGTLFLGACGGNTNNLPEGNIDNNGNQIEGTTPPKEEEFAPTRLSTPAVHFDKGTIAWNKVKNATKYEVLINDEVTITYNTSLTLAGITLTPTEYTVQVKAISENPKYLNSQLSDELKFDTHQLSPVAVQDIEYVKPYSEVSVTLSNFYGDFINIYINNIFFEQITTPTFNLSNSPFNSGYNTLTFISGSKNPYILNSVPVDIKIYKNNDFYDAKLEDGKILCRKTADSSYEIYDTSKLSGGSQTINIENFSYPGIMQPYAKIIFCSDGIKRTFYKIAKANIVSCEYVLPYNSNLHTVRLKLQNFNTDPLLEDRIALGYDYNKIEIIFDTNISGNTCSFIYDIPSIANYNEYAFTFYSDLSYRPTWVNIILHKEGYISSTPVIYEF